MSPLFSSFSILLEIKTHLKIADTEGFVNLVLDMSRQNRLTIAHERWGSSSNPVLNGNLHHPAPTGIGKPLNEDVVVSCAQYVLHGLDL